MAQNEPETPPLRCRKVAHPTARRAADWYTRAIHRTRVQDHCRRGGMVRFIPCILSTSELELSEMERMTGRGCSAGCRHHVSARVHIVDSADLHHLT